MRNVKCALRRPHRRNKIGNVDKTHLLCYHVTDVRRTEGAEGWTVTVKRIRPSKLQTADMAAWHLFLKVQAGKVITPQDAITIQIEDE